ncbi:MAG: DUF4124 domain-containing protein [Chromatiales bacterium]|nr:DUF4124 domain-containing protein [Chromatiales bacterium]
MRHTLLTTLILALLLSTTPAQAAKLYKWTDEDGNVHYSQKPRNHTGDDEAVINQPQSEPQVEVEATPIEIPEPTDDPVALAAAERCQQLLHDLELYRDNRQITDSEGNVMVVSREMREAKVNELNAQLDESCR